MSDILGTFSKDAAPDLSEAIVGWRSWNLALVYENTRLVSHPRSIKPFGSLRPRLRPIVITLKRGDASVNAESTLLQSERIS